MKYSNALWSVLFIIGGAILGYNNEYIASYLIVFVAGMILNEPEKENKK